MKMNIRPILLTVNRPITPDEVEICQKIFDHLRPLPHFDQPNAQNIAIALGEFAVQFRSRNGSQAMLDYIEWAIAHDETPGILPTVMHDLNDRYDEGMSPRTSGYLGVNKEKQHE